MDSPLAKITRTLQTVKRSAESYQTALESNEASTRAALVDPIISSLGWNLGNPFMVEVEKQIPSGRLDYALLDSSQNVAVIIESKKLGENLDDEKIFLSLVNYAYSIGVGNVFLTDSLRWNHFTSFEPSNKKPSKSISLIEDDLVTVASYLVETIDVLRYWPEQKDQSQLAQDVYQIQAELTSITAKISSLQSEDKEVLSVVREEQASELIKLADIDNPTFTKPYSFILPNGRKILVEHWTDVLIQSGLYFLERTDDLPIPLKDASHGRVELISNSPPPYGVTYYELKYKETPIFLYTNYDSRNCIRNSLYLLGKIEDADLDVVQAAFRSTR